MPAGRALGELPVEQAARAGIRRVDEHDVGRAVRRGRERRIAGRERLDHERDPLADPAHLGERLAAVELRAGEADLAHDLDDALRALVAEHADGDDPRGRRWMMSRTVSMLTCRRLPGAKTKPSASAPRATARSASSSLVMPQIFTNTRTRRYPGDAPAPCHSGAGVRGPWSGVDQAAVEEVVVGGQVEEAVAGVVEQDHPLLAGLLGREGLVDRGTDRVTGLRCGDLPLGAWRT